MILSPPSARVLFFKWALQKLPDQDQFQRDLEQKTFKSAKLHFLNIFYKYFLMILIFLETSNHINIVNLARILSTRPVHYLSFVRHNRDILNIF